MGTSSNHPSPRTPSWALARGALAHQEITPTRQSTELWRAAAEDETAELVSKLTHPMILRACALAGEASSPSEAMSSYEDLLVESHSSGLVFDMARRALARTVAVSAGQRGFAAELFSELVSYYSSRDLPSFVAAPGRVKTTSEAIRLKEQLRDIARQTARHTSPFAIDPNGWAAFVKAVVVNLQAAALE